jgi:CTP:molybdopterin cytidylyltransferase MocA
MNAPRVVGLLLAAGEGRRMGAPKALLRDAGGVPYLERAIGGLFNGGCAVVTVVLGAAASEARDLLADGGWADDPDLSVVVAQDHTDGMGASLRAGLGSLAEPELDAALVMLVDLPDVGAAVVRRVLQDAAQDSLTRATYAGRPGHPVLIGRTHWTGVLATLSGDRGARAYLDAHGVKDIACDDLATGRDLDRPEDLGLA